MIQILHRFTGLLLTVFVFSHLAVHLTALAGINAHIASL
jgi:succinate dehydrogenase/fumarate reductase cytochrome b subunit